MNAPRRSARHRKVRRWLIGWAKANRRTWTTPITDATGLDGGHYRVRVHPDGRHALTINRSGAVATWDLGPEATPRRSSQTDGSRVFDAAFLPDGSAYVSALLGGPVEVWSWD